MPPNINNVNSTYLVPLIVGRTLPTTRLRNYMCGHHISDLTRRRHRRSMTTFTTLYRNTKNNSTSTNDVEFTHKCASKTSLNSQTRLTSTQYEACRPLLPAELGTRGPPEFLYETRSRPGSGCQQDHVTGDYVTSGHHMRESG